MAGCEASVSHLSRIPIPAFDKDEYSNTLRLLIQKRLNTVCLSANCPNRYECFAQKTATFMILGDICTRNCTYCNIACGRPHAVDEDEPKRIREAIDILGIEHAVITCVTRDDLADGGASQFVKVITEIKEHTNCVVEVLISDLRGNWDALHDILTAGPDILNHNIETVPRIFKMVRRGGKYERSLELLQKVREFNSIHGTSIKIKSGMMVGLGETEEEVYETQRDILTVGCNMLTIGQYLSPSQNHAKVSKYYTQKEFDILGAYAKKQGFTGVSAGIMVRSSYHAKKMANNTN
ncbi:MAG: lipoyl synthase [Candidatus Woesearchaeota archaeon]